MMRWRMSGLRIGGSGIEMSSNAMVSRMPGVSSSGSGSSPSGLSSACRIAASTSGTAGQRLGRVDHPGPQRELLEPEALSLMDDDRRGPVVDLEHETWTAHLILLGSNATFTVPSRPAEWAWSSASRHRCSG